MIATTLDELSKNSRSVSEEKIRPKPSLLRIINTALYSSYQTAINAEVHFDPYSPKNVDPASTITNFSKIALEMLLTRWREDELKQSAVCKFFFLSKVDEVMEYGADEVSACCVRSAPEVDQTVLLRKTGPILASHGSTNFG